MLKLDLKGYLGGIFLKICSLPLPPRLEKIDASFSSHTSRSESRAQTLRLGITCFFIETKTILCFIYNTTFKNINLCSVIC